MMESFLENKTNYFNEFKKQEGDLKGHVGSVLQSVTRLMERKQQKA